MSEQATFHLLNVRLPLWLLPVDWPSENNEPLLANIEITDNCFSAITVAVPDAKVAHGNAGNCLGNNQIDLAGRLALPALVDAHTHLDKTYTRQRLGTLEPGLLNAIGAMMADQRFWDHQDLTIRVQQALAKAVKNGVCYLRSHVDWGADTPPLAWSVLAEQANVWKNRLRLQRVALVPLPFLSSQSQVDKIAKTVKSSDDAVMGAFIHSSNFNPESIHWLVEAAVKFELDLDLHIDEELSPEALGLSCLLDALENTHFAGRIVCGHLCALSQKPYEVALGLLDRVAKQPITMIALPATNLLLQDDVPDCTPRQRGLTLVHEAKARGIPIMFASDNVQDSFCSFGNYDPVEALRLGAYSAQLNNIFDEWSQAICRTDWLSHTRSRFTLIGQPADLTVFDSTSAVCWPNNDARLLLRKGAWVESQPSSFMELAESVLG